jgi:putative ABC transport system ATP-binding protein
LVLPRNEGNTQHAPRTADEGPIARSVIASPDIILADEPTGNLDSKSGTEIMDLFKRINEEKKITILQVTHSNEAAGYGRRIIRLKDGMIEKDQLEEAVAF